MPFFLPKSVVRQLFYLQLFFFFFFSFLALNELLHVAEELVAERD